MLIARLRPHGWIGTAFHEQAPSSHELRDDLIDERGVIATDNTISLVVADTQLLVLQQSSRETPPRVARLENRKLTKSAILALALP